MQWLLLKTLVGILFVLVGVLVGALLLHKAVNLKKKNDLLTKRVKDNSFSVEEKSGVDVSEYLNKKSMETVYVPIPAHHKPYATMWEDHDYLRHLSEWTNDNRFTIEVTECVRSIREALDEAKPEEIPGLKRGLIEVKRLLCIPAYAQNRLEEIKAMEKAKKSQEELEKKEADAHDFSTR